MVANHRKNIKFYILASSFIFSVISFFVVTLNISIKQLQIIRLTQTYALCALTFLYMALLADPLYYVFKKFPLRQKYLEAKSSIIISTFYFGLLHANLAFFGQLGGFEGLGFLSNSFLLAILLALTALVILFSFTVTSFDFVAKKIKSPRWRILQHAIYVVGLFILIHALMLGSHFANQSSIIFQIFSTLIILLLFLEAIRIDDFLQKKFNQLPRLGFFSSIILGYVILSIGGIFSQTNAPSSFGIHSKHIQLAKDSSTLNSGPNNQNANTERRFTITPKFSESINPNEDTILSFKVFDAASGNQVFRFDNTLGKIAHLVIVDSKLNYFNHIHPDFKNGEFTITTQFPQEETYHLYLDIQPKDATEQQIASTLTVGTEPKIKSSNSKIDLNRTKIFGEYEVRLATPNPLIATEMSIGNQALTFTINDSKTKEPIKSLKPYLESFGHLVMINAKTYEYVHVHPNDHDIPSPDSVGGPSVEFSPIGLYGAIKPGMYRIFAQFNPDNELFVADYTIEVK